MRALWKIAASVVLIAASVAAWQIHKTKAQKRKLSDAAQVALLRAQQGDPQAQYDLGHMYFHGDGAPQNYTEALRWYRKSAEQNNAKAQSVLGYIYFYGQGAPHDYAEALCCYRLAAGQGDAQAQYDVSYMYRYGKGVPQNFAEANRWVSKSADQGNKFALIVVSHNLMGLTKITLLIELLAGLLFTFSFLPANFLESGKSLRDPRQQLFTATGVLILSTAGLNWYGYTHYKLRKIGYGTNTFTIFHWLLEAVVIALLLYTVNFGNKPSIGQVEDDSVPLS